MLAIGLMSGTSLDGVDAALVRFEKNQVKLEHFIVLEYDEEFKSRLFRNLHDKTARLSEISTLNFELGHWFLKAVNLLLERSNHSYQDIDFVASHGQTIWHDPHGKIPSTLQIGEASVISYHTNIPTISNFRVMDVVAGGEGAPLVPFSEYMMFSDPTKNVVLQNIGGISNLTFLEKNATLSEVLSFDCGVGNIMIDYFVKKYFGLPFDDGGKIALSGQVVTEVLEELKKDAFVVKKPPKSTGREQYSHEFMDQLALKMNFDSYKKEDIIATITEFTVYGIVYNYNHFLKEVDLAIINGGGSHNQYIIKRLKEQLAFEVKTGEEFGINSDAKEAVAFAVLGYMSLQGKPSNVKAATGAKDDVVLGNIIFSPRKQI